VHFSLRTIKYKRDSSGMGPHHNTVHPIALWYPYVAVHALFLSTRPFSRWSMPPAAPRQSRDTRNVPSTGARARSEPRPTTRLLRSGNLCRAYSGRQAFVPSSRCTFGVVTQQQTRLL
jgi:hypothetical protein